jgi:hypothetical protein
MSDWYSNHIPFPEWDWRHKISYRLYVLADWVMRDHVHEVVIRDGQGTSLMSMTARVPTVSMPPVPYSVWCCDGRLDDGIGGVRGGRAS